MSSSKRIAIIGSGVSGLTSIKACLEEDLNPFCYEQNENIGGTFLYSDTISPNHGCSVYSTITTNTCKTTTCFSDFPIPKEEAMFLPHDRYLKYLNDYAKRFDLLQHINFNTQVKQVMKSKDYEKSGNWIVCMIDLKSNEKKEETFDGVIICSGFLRNPFVPSIPGMEKFKGEIMHSKTYRKPNIFKDKRVLVIGNAHSAGDISVDATCNALKVYLSIGSGTWIFPRLSNGDPADFKLTRFLFSFPLSYVGRILSGHCNTRLNHEMTGINHTAPFNCNWMVNDDIQYRILSGRITVKNHVTEFTESGVKFDDNSVEDFDLVVFATGFKYGADFIDESIIPKTYEQTNVYKMVWPVILPLATLALIGFQVSLGPIPPVSELQARWVARVFAKKCNLPSKKVMLKEINANKQDVLSRYGKYVVRFIYLSFRDSIADEIGVTPRFWNILFKDPRLAFMCFFGPAFPAQFRLRGPHKWEGASKVCYESYNDTYYPSILTRKRNEKQKESSISRYLGILVLVLGIWGFRSLNFEINSIFY